jgi:hypothetical protein
VGLLEVVVTPKKPTLAHPFKQATARVAFDFASEVKGDSGDIKLQKERYTTDIRSLPNQFSRINAAMSVSR